MAQLTWEDTSALIADVVLSVARKTFNAAPNIKALSEYIDQQRDNQSCYATQSLTVSNAIAFWFERKKKL